MTARPRPTVNAGATARTPEGGCTAGAGQSEHAAAGSVTLVCFREGHAEFIPGWDSVADAEEAMLLGPCDASCRGIHSATFIDAAGRPHTTSGPAPVAMTGTVVPGSWRGGSHHRRLVRCPFCDGQHDHQQRHVGTVRPAGCLRGFYLIIKGDNENE